MTKEELNILLERVKANRAKGPSSILGVVKGPRARAKKRASAASASRW